MFLTVRGKKKIRCLEIALSRAINSEIQLQFSGPSYSPILFLCCHLLVIFGPLGQDMNDTVVNIMWSLYNIQQMKKGSFSTLLFITKDSFPKTS